MHSSRYILVEEDDRSEELAKDIESIIDIIAGSSDNFVKWFNYRNGSTLFDKSLFYKPGNVIEKALGAKSDDQIKTIKKSLTSEYDEYKKLTARLSQQKYTLPEREFLGIIDQIFEECTDNKQAEAIVNAEPTLSFLRTIPSKNHMHVSAVISLLIDQIDTNTAKHVLSVISRMKKSAKSSALDFRALVEKLTSIVSRLTDNNISLAVLRQLTKNPSLPAGLHVDLANMAHDGEEFYDDNFNVVHFKHTLSLVKIGRETIIRIIEEFVENTIQEAEENDERLYKSKNPEGPDDGVLNKYAFADERYGQVPREKDAKAEKELYLALDAHFNENSPLSVEAAEKIHNILKSGEYSSIFHPPSENVIYRGMNVSEKWLRDALGISETDELENEGAKAASFTFNPRPGIGGTSWTVDEDVANSFTSWSQAVPWRIVMTAQCSDNPNKLAVGFDGLYKVDQLANHDTEVEVLALGDIRVVHLRWEKAPAPETTDMGDLPF